MCGEYFEIAECDDGFHKNQLDFLEIDNRPQTASEAWFIDYTVLNSVEEDVSSTKNIYSENTLK